jgi:hypothetical protein
VTPTAQAIPTAGVSQPCQCFQGKRLPPLRVHLEAARRVRAALAPSGIPLGAVLLDYRCPQCKSVVPLTIGKLLAIDTP